MVTELFQVGLQKLEHLFVLLRSVFRHVISVRIGPLKNRPAINDHLEGVFEELNFLDWVVLDFEKLVNLPLDNRAELLCKPFGLIVVFISLVVEHVPVELIFGVFTSLLLCYQFGILFHLFVLIAFVVTTCGGSVLFPRSLTHPAEVVAALLTFHMVAPLILLDGLRALRTSLCVGHDPSQIFTLCLAFKYPLFSHLAVAGHMGELAALEAETGSTGALY